MPAYDYKCVDSECPERGEPVEVFLPYDSGVEPTCSVCSTRLAKQFSSPGIIFNAPGFYKTDNKRR